MAKRTLKFMVAGAAIGSVAVMSASQAMADSKGYRMGKATHWGMNIAFTDLDADEDGQLSQEEFDAAVAVWLAGKDSDGDGMLSQEELAEAMLARMMEIAERSSSMMMDGLDDDDDGMISADEIGHRRDSAKVFSRLDENDDGMISQEEFDSMKSKGERGRRGGKRGDRHGQRGKDRK